MRYLALVYMFLSFINRMLTVRRLFLPLSQNFVLTLRCLLVFFCINRSVFWLFRSATAVVDHAETFLAIFKVATLWCLRIVMFDNAFWYMTLHLKFFLCGDSIFVLDVIMSMWLSVFTIITLARISAQNAVLVTLAVFLLALRPLASTPFEMHIL